MTREEWIADRMAVLREADDIAQELDRIVQTYGEPEDAADIRRRLHEAAGRVLAQLSGGTDVAVMH